MKLISWKLRNVNAIQKIEDLTRGNQYLFFLSLVVIIILSCAAPDKIRKPAAGIDPLEELRQNIDLALQDSSLYQTTTGIKVVSLETGEVLFAKNNQLLFHPASNMKLLTTATALKRLGPNFKFKTVLYIDTSSISNGVITGNLYLKGYGNPDLLTEDLEWLAHQVRFRGITRIQGDLICDESYFDDLFRGHGWMWDDASSSDFPAISALSVNDNCVEVTVCSGPKVGDSLIFQMEPSTSYVKIENKATTVDSLDTLAQKAFKVERKWIHPENTIFIEGGRKVGVEERSYDIDVLEPALYAGTLLRQKLQEENIVIEGSVKKGMIPDTFVVLVEHLSEPLSMVVMNTNKISDNLSAELTLKTIAAEVLGVPGTADKGITIIHQLFDELGMDSTAYRLADGSGVSRYNVITPDLIIELLKAMNEDFGVQAEYKTSLPIAGVDGTLKSRMRETSAENKLRAKTGTLSGVSALSGYTTSAEGELIAFSIIMEHFVVPTSKIRNVQDRIGDLLSSFRRHLTAAQ
jgi:D-alanyl-D-alanine carboxypeptidase/D-alanyl-D-alanine-endopeptidase (penicillin-binding protein 4)